MIEPEKWIHDYSTSQILCAYENFVAAFSAPIYTRDADEPSRSKLAFSLLFYAEALALAGKILESNGQLEVAKKLLQKADTHSQHLAMEVPARGQLLIDRVDAKSRVPDTAKERKNVSLEFAKRAKKLMDWPAYREDILVAIRQSFEAKETAKLETRAAEAKDYIDILKTYLKFEDQVVHSAAFLCTAVNQFGFVYAQTGANPLEHHMNMIQEFEKDFPDFSIPVDAVILTHFASQVARALGDTEAYERYQTAEQDWNDKCPWMVERSGQYVLKDELPDKYSSRFWIDSVADSATAEVATKLILRWIKAEFHQNKLSETEVEELLQWARFSEAFAGGDGPLTQSVNFDALTCNATNQLCAVLFGAAEKPTENKVWEHWFSRLKYWLQLDRPPSQYQRLIVLKQVQYTRSLQLQIYTRNIPFLNRLSQTENVRKELKKSLQLYQEIHKSNSSAVTEYELLRRRFLYAGSIVTLASSWRAVEEGFLTDDLILEAITVYESSAFEFEARDELLDLHKAINNIGTMTRSRWQLFGSVDVGSCLPYFRRAEEVYRGIRRQDAIRNSSRALISKDLLAERLNIPLLYNMARSAAILAYDTYSLTNQADLMTAAGASNLKLESHQSEVIYWCQTSKARALTDILGLEAEIPASMMAIIKESPGAEQSLEKEKAILHDINSVSLSQKVKLREQLKQLQDCMRQDEPILRPVLDMRAGDCLSAKELVELSETMGTNVVIVDWVVVFGLAIELYMLIYREGKLCQMIPLPLVPKKVIIRQKDQAQGSIDRKAAEEEQNKNKPKPPEWIRMDQVEAWVNKYLTEELPLERRCTYNAAPSAVLNCRQLLSLVIPLQEHTKEGERIIFCPTRSLYRIPLHALKLRGKPIIERNPVVYIQSISLLRFSLQLSERADARNENVLRAIIFNTLDNDDEAAQSVERLRDILSATTTSQFTKKDFSQLGAQADLIHVQGHVVFNEDDPLPLKQHLVLGRPGEDPNKQLTADEICNIKFQPGALIMAMGCNSGRARQSDCDDLLGLTAAFHCAGAATVVSTLWKIDVNDCTSFSIAFYTYIMEQLRDCEATSASVDLAVAMQKGVTAVRYDEAKRERDPYHWAGFVLHGSWKFPRRRLPSRDK